MRTLIKKVALKTLRSAGIFSVAANSARRRQRLAILCYHGISLRDEHEWSGLLYMSPELFRRRLEILKQFGANVLPLDEALQRLANGSLPSRSVVITFDDGFYDFFHYATPILSEFSYPSTLYLATHYSKYPVPIFNLIVPYLLWKSGRSTIDLSVFGLPGERPVQTYEQRRVVAGALQAEAEKNHLDTNGKNNYARRLAGFLGIDYDDLLRSRMFQILSPEEAAAVDRAGVDIQLHTHRHRTPRDRDLFMREITDNAAHIREITGRFPSHFCYPSGDYAPEFLPWLREANIKSATTCVLALARSRSEPLLLPRLLDHSFVSDVEFESWLCGVRV